MRRKKPKRGKKEKRPNVSQDLEEFQVRLNTFGEVESNYNIDDINQFLNKNLRDKKLDDRRQKKKRNSPGGKKKNT